MKKRNLLFCVIFTLICVLPLVGMLILGPSAAGSNEVLTNAPQLIKKNGTLNADYLSDLSDYVRDRFGFRQELITANAKVTAALFGESATEKVILGEDGWLYYADTLADFEGTAPMTDRQIWCAAHTLGLMEEFARSRGASFVFAAAPNKNTLYPDHMPYEKTKQPSNLERLHQALDAEGVTYCDLLSVLAQTEEAVYYKTDSHWDGYGSALAHDALMKTLGVQTQLSSEAFAETAHRGDLTDMLYPASRDMENGLSLRRERTFSYEGAVRGPDDMVIRTVSEGKNGTLLMFRDSFGNTLHQDLAESFSQACFSRAMPYDLSMLDADTLIVEIVERNLVDLSTKAPLMEAPVREMEIPEHKVSAKVTVKTAKCKLEGCVEYSGFVEGEMDWNSPVFVAVDGVVYEATPAGKTENAFTLYAPEGEHVQVLYYLDGRLVLAQ